MRYAAACEKAQEYEAAVVEDPMTEAYGAPVDDILEGYMAKHIKQCEACKQASIEASMP